MCDTAYDETAEEIIKHAVNRNSVDVNRFINRDRTIDLIRGIDATLIYMHGEKERSDKDKTCNELNNADARPMMRLTQGTTT